MSKITFRADDDLVERLERLDVSKSEAMREALRTYLAADGPAGGRKTERDHAAPERTGAVDDVIRERVDELLADRLAELGLESPADRHGPHVHERYRGETEDVTISVTVPQPTRRSLEDDRRAADRRTRLEQRDVDGAADAHTRVDDGADDSGEHEPSDETTARCGQCGEHVDDDHVYCPNCGEKASRRLFCDCGDEIRSDWSFCPSCGRRTPAAGVLGRDSPT